MAKISKAEIVRRKKNPSGFYDVMSIPPVKTLRPVKLNVYPLTAKEGEKLRDSKTDEQKKYIHIVEAQ